MNWTSSTTEILYNSLLPKREQGWLRQARLPDLKSHVWLTSSSTTSPHQLQVVALSKKALLISAEAVNKHIGSDTKDQWLNVLPPFHVGGLAIEARAHLSGAGVIDKWSPSWNPTSFTQIVRDCQATLTSLVPTQVYDLVKRDLQAPESLRGVLVGGGALSVSLYQEAWRLNWPLWPTYGLTECGGQVATAPVRESTLEKNITPLHTSPHRELPHRGFCEPTDHTPPLPPLKILSHVEVRLSTEGRLEIKSPSLFLPKGSYSRKQCRNSPQTGRLVLHRRPGHPNN